MGTQERKQGEKSKTDFREMTAAHIREPKNDNRKCKEILKRLREAVEKKLAVRVQLDTPHGDVIEDVG